MRMALHFVSAGAHAPHSEETPGPTATRGSSHSARRLRSLAFLFSSEAGNPPRPHRSGTRGRAKQSPVYNLIRRLRERRNEALPALPHRPALSLRQQPGRTRPAHTQTQAESLWLLPLRYRRRRLCHPAPTSQLSANNPTIF